MTLLSAYPNSKLVDDNSLGDLNITWAPGMTQSNDTPNFKGATPMKLLIPPSFITADLTFYEYDVNGNPLQVNDLTGSQVKISGAAASNSYPLDQTVFAAVKRFYIVASSAQTHGIVITMALAPMWG